MKKSKILLISLVLVLVISFIAIYVNNYHNKESTVSLNENKTDYALLRETIENTCFDEYNSIEGFKSMTFGDVIDKLIDSNPDICEANYHYNEKIPDFETLKNNTDKINMDLYDYVSCSMCWELINYDNSFEYQDILFAVDKKSKNVVPLAISSNGNDFEFKSPDDIIETAYLIMSVVVNSNTTSAEDKTNLDDYLQCIIINDDGLAYFDMTIDEFITHYNRTVDNSDNGDMLKALMKLNEQPSLISSSDGVDIYDVTNSAIASNRSAVKMTITTLEGERNVFSVNVVVPSSAGPDTDISDLITRTTVCLTTPTNSLDSNSANKMFNEFKSNGFSYYKGLFFGYYEQQSARIYRIGALTEENFNQIK